MKVRNHELMHPVSDEGAWSESYYFNFVDPQSRLGMFTRMGFRPNDGWADALHTLFLDGSRIAFTYGRRDIETDLAQYDGDLAVGNLKIDLLEPFKRWRLTYAGPAQDIADGSILMARRKLRPNDWYIGKSLEMELLFDCSSEPHYSHSDSAQTRGHFEQCGRVTGRIKLGESEWAVDGYGIRDKSWGPRDWGAGQRDRGGNETQTANPIAFSSEAAPNPFVNWFSMNFGDEIALGGSCFRRASGEMKGAGWIFRDGVAAEFADVEIRSTYRAQSILHDAITLTGKVKGGEVVQMTGKVINMCPTKVPMPNGATFINEGLVEFNWGERVGYGIAEHWHAVTNGEG
ncbi:MAG: hypothetical protein AAF541_09860 [Pseudomonadota bacterium]